MLYGNHVPGAGVLLIETYAKKPSIILFRNTVTKEFEDPGGMKDANETYLQCAQRELHEESLGLFDLNLSSCPTFNAFPHYTTYVAFIKGPVIKSDYDGNFKILSSMEGVPSHWRETDMMMRFFVDELVIAGLMMQRTKLHVNDVYGTHQIISHRATTVIREAIDMFGFIVPSVVPHDVRWNTLKVHSKGIGHSRSSLRAATEDKTHTYSNKRWIMGCAPWRRRTLCFFKTT